SDDRILIYYPKIFPSAPLDVSLRIYFAAMLGFDPDRFHSFLLPDGTGCHAVCHPVCVSVSLHMCNISDISHFDLDGLDLFTLSFNACPLSINAPPGPSYIFLMYTVEIHSIARFDLHRFETEALFCCTYDCIFCDILIHFISNVPDMNCDIHMIYRLDPEGFDPSVLAYAS